METKRPSMFGWINGFVAALLLTLSGCSTMMASSGGSDLVDRAGKGDLMAVKALLDSGVDPDARGERPFYQTALMAAAWRGHLDVVRLLLDRGAAVNAKDGNGGTALISAAESGDPTLVRLLLDRGADVNAQTVQDLLGYLLLKEAGLSDDRATWGARRMGGRTALIDAAGGGYLDVVRLLLDRGAAVNAQKNDGTTALLAAAEKGHEEIVRVLITAGADVNAKTADGKTPIGEARKKGYTGVVEVLRKAGANE